MLTVEYRVNGQLIGFTNIKNIGLVDDKVGMYYYEFNHKPIELAGTMSGCLTHKREDGFEVLVQKVLQKITKQR